MNMKRTWTAFLLSCAAVGIASAQVTTYNTRLSWLAATSRVTTIDFTTAARPPAGFYSIYPPPGLTLSDVNFSNTRAGGSIVVISQTYCCATYARGYDQLDSDTGVQVTLPAGTTAFGFDLFTVISGNALGTNQDPVDVTIAGQKYTAVTAVAPNNVFIGFVSASPISSFTIIPQQVHGATQVDVMNFSFNNAAPHISAGGVVGAGLSTPPLMALSPNAIVTVFGDAFAPAGTVRPVVSADLINGRLPTVVNGVCVYVNNVPAPLFFSSSTQINFQVPRIPTSGNVDVQVAISCGTPNEVRSSMETVAAAAANPEFFYFKQSADGKNPIAAFNATNGIYIGPAGLIPGSNFVAAAPGDILTLFFTGGGTTNPAFAPGELPGGVGIVTSLAGVGIGGTQLSTIDILYAGVAPGLAGLYQLNIRIPASVQQGNQAVVLTIGGSPSPAGYLLIAP
jgi:uncharacterized protein (TIGR03437 family)